MPRPRIYGGHPYIAGIVTKTDARGHLMPLCADCQAPQNSPRHRSYAIAGPPPPRPERVRRPKVSRRAADWHRPRPRGRRPKYQEIPWEVRLLAMALDRALGAGPDVLGWRAAIRAGDLRNALDEIIPRDPEPEPIAIPEPEPEAPDPEPEPARIRPSPTSWAAVPPSQLARARAQTKGIRSDRFRDLVVRAILQGARIEKRRSGHMLLIGGPLTRPISLSMTSDGGGRTWENLRASARRAGLDTAGL